MALIDQLRAKYSDQYRSMTDQEVANHLYDTYYAKELPRAAFFKQLGVAVPESSFAEIVAKDIPLAGAQGVVSAYDAAKELTGLVPFTKGKIPKAIEKGEKALTGGTSADLQQYLESLKSEEQQMITKGAEEVPKTGNLIQDTIAQLQYAGVNPQQIPQIIAQSFPSMYEGALAGKALQKGSTALRGKELSDVAAATAGEGIVSAGSTAGGIRHETSNQELSGEQQILSAFSGYLTNRLGKLGNKTSSLMGIDDMDVILTRGNVGVATDAAAIKAKSRLVTALKTAINESLIEELPQSAQEQVTQNLALGKPWDDGLAEQLAGGIIGGAGAGGMFGAYHQHKMNQVASDLPPSPTNKNAEPPTADIEVPKNDTKKNAKLRQDIIDSAEDEETKKSLEELLKKPKKGQTNGTQQSPAGTSDDVSGGPGDGTTEGTEESVGSGVAGDTTDEYTDTDGTGRSDVALEPITVDSLGKPFKSTGQAHKYRRENKLQDSYSVEKQADGVIALVPKIPVIEQAPTVTATKKTKAPTKEAKVEEVEDIPDEEIGWESFEETKPDGSITSGFRRKQVAAKKDAPVVKESKTPKSTEVLKTEENLTPQDKADLDQEEADEESARQARIDEANNKEGMADQPDYVKTGSLLAEQSPAEESNNPVEARKLAVKHAAFDQAMDEFDTASIKDFDTELKRLADEKKAKTNKDYSINRPLEFMEGLTQAQRFSNYYKLFNKFLGKKNLAPRRIKHATTRNEFLNTLSKEERKLFNKLYSRYISTEVKAMKSGVSSTDETETDEAALYRKLQNEIALVAKGKGSQEKVDKYKADYAASRARTQKASLSRQIVEKDTSEISNRVTNLEQAIKDGENEIKSIKVAKKIKDKAAQIKAVQTKINKDRAELKRAKAELQAAERVTTVLGAPGRYTNISDEEKALKLIEKQKKKDEILDDGTPEQKMEVIDDETEEQAKKFLENEKIKAEEKAKEKAKKQPKITVAGRLNKIVASAITQGKGLVSVLSDLYDSKNQQKDRSYQRTALLFNEVLDRLQKKGYKVPTIEFGAVANDRPGMYNPETNTITINIDTDQEYGRVVVHETLHYLLDHIVEEYQNNPNSDLLSAAQKVYLKSLLESYDYAMPLLGEKYKGMAFKEFLAEAVEGSEFSIALGKLDPLPGRILPFLKDLARSIAGMLGFRIEHGLPAVDKGGPAKAYILEAVLHDIESIITGEDYKATNPLFRSSEISFARKIDLSNDDEEAKKVDKTYDQLIEGYGNPGLTTKNALQKVNEKIPKGQAGIDELATVFSNSRFVLERTQDNMVRSGDIRYDDDGFNNFYDYISTTFGRAQWFIKQYVDLPRKQYIRTIANFASANKVTNDYAANVLKGYDIAFHAPERRKTKWLLNVPLNKLNKIKFKSELFGTIDDTPANIREFITAKVSDPIMSKLSEDQATTVSQSLQRDLIRLVNTKNAIDAAGYSPAGYKKTGITEADYNVIEDHNFNDEQLLRSKYMGESDTNKVLIQQFFDTKRKLLDAAKDLNRIAGYWSTATDAVVSFYGWKNYSPYKVRPGDKSAFKMNIEGTALGRTGKEYPGSRFEGSVADVENPVTQVLVEVVQAAARAGGKDAMRALRNAIKQKILEGHLLNSNGKPRKKGEMDVPTYTFQDRYTGKVDETLLKKQNVIYVYNPDGSMDLMEVTNPRQLEAIRRTYSTNEDHFTGMFWNMLQWSTSKVGQWHTRLNLGFPPYNFVRDVLTNAGIMSIRENPALAARILLAASKEIVGVRGIAKAARFSTLFHNNDIAKINDLAKNDLFYQALKEYGENGGSVSIIQGLSAASAMEMLAGQLDKNFKISTEQQISKYFDIYGSMFEFAARIAVYKVLKSQYYNQLKREHPSYTPTELEKASIIKAVAATKNLANFEEVGTHGKKLGAYFMFFRASATGNRQYLKTLSPAWRKYEAVANTLPKVTQDNPVAMANFKKKFMKDKLYARLMTAVLMGVGMAVWYGLRGLADDDKDKDQEGRNKVATDDARRWTRNARVYLGYDANNHKDRVGNIPWGFGPSAFMAAGAQIAAYNSGDGMEFKDLGVNLGLIAMDSFLPIPVSNIDPTNNFSGWLVDTVSPSVGKGFIEYAMNLNGVDQPIYRGSASKYSAAFLGTDATPEIFRDFARWANESTHGLGPLQLNLDANSMYFYANNYFDGMAKFADSIHGGYMVLTGKKDFDIEKDAFFFDSFLATTSNLDAQRYDTLKTQIETRSKNYESYKLNNPTLASRYANIDYPNLETKIKVLKHFDEKYLKPLKEANNRISSDPNITARERQALKYQNRQEQNHIKKGLYDTLKNIDAMSQGEIESLVDLIDHAKAEETVNEYQPDLGY